MVKNFNNTFKFDSSQNIKLDKGVEMILNFILNEQVIILGMHYYYPSIIIFKYKPTMYRMLLLLLV